MTSDQVKMSMQVSRRSGRFLAASIAVIIAGLLTGCSGGNVASHTMTKAQATARAEQILRKTAAGLNPKPRLEVNSLLTVTDQCLANIPNASQMVNVAYSYWLRGIPESENGNIGLQIRSYWQKQGYRIDTSSGFGKGRPDISGMTKDGFLVSLNWSSNGALSIGATSPCIYPDGTPPS